MIFEEEEGLIISKGLIKKINNLYLNSISLIVNLWEQNYFA